MKLRVLITDNAPLYPPLWGGPKRVWNLYGNFSRELFNFTYVGVNFSNSSKQIKDNFKEILSALPFHYYPWYVIKKHILKNMPFDLFLYLWLHTDRQFKYTLNSQQAGIVILSHPWASLSIDKKPGQLFIYDAHNCEYLLMDKILENNFLKNMVLRQVKKIEEDACKKSDLILACSEKEKNDFIGLYKIPAEKIIIVPNGTNINKNNNSKNKALCREELGISTQEKVVIFIGAYYKPNIEAVEFIVNKIAPALKDFKLLIAGSVSEFFTEREIPCNILLLGKLSNEKLETALIASDIAINPVTNGSGTNIKMLDYMSYGLPIVTSQCGARGIKTNGKQPLIISSESEFADNIRLIAADNVLSNRMSQDGKALTAESYDWKIISRELETIILQKLKNHAG